MLPLILAASDITFPTLTDTPNYTATVGAALVFAVTFLLISGLASKAIKMVFSRGAKIG